MVNSAKAKPIEAAMDDMKDMECPWINTKIEFSLRLSRPLVPPWKPPPKPQKSLVDIISQRPLQPPPEPKTALAEFQDEVNELISSDEFHSIKSTSTVSSNSKAGVRDKPHQKRYYYPGQEHESDLPIKHVFVQPFLERVENSDLCISMDLAVRFGNCWIHYVRSTMHVGTQRLLMQKSTKSSSLSSIDQGNICKFRQS